MSLSEETESESVVEEPKNETTPKAKRARKSVMSPILASALDGVKVLGTLSKLGRRWRRR